MVGVSLQMLHLNAIFPLLGFFINSHAHTHLNKMVWLNINIVTLLKQAFLSWLIPLYPHVIGLKPLTPLFTQIWAFSFPNQIYY